MGKKKQTSPYFTSCMEYWNNWYIRETGLVPKIDGSQGKALKEILKYFESNYQESTSEQCFIAILDNWKRLSNFNQQFRSLREINSRLNNILNEIKNGTVTAKNSMADSNKRNLSELAIRAEEALRSIGGINN